MPTGKISKSSIDALPKPAERAVVFWDAELKGFGCKVTPAGRKVYLVQYRLGGRAGRSQKVMLGTHGNLTPDKARRAAKAILGQVADGVDVAAEKRQAKQAHRAALTVEQVSSLFIEKHAKVHLKPSSVAEYERLLAKRIVPLLGSILVGQLTRGDVKNWHTDLRATPITANRSAQLLSTIMNWAIDGGYRPDRQNPVSRLKRFKETSKDRFLSEAELSALGAAIEQAEAVGVPWNIQVEGERAKHLAAEENRTTRVDPYAAAAIRLLIFTGARKSEILSLKWEHVDLVAGVLRLPDSKTGAKVIRLSAPAREILANIDRVEGNSFVIPGEKANARRADLFKPWRAICKLAGLKEVRLHDLRHTAASVSVAAGISLPVIGGLLGHKNPRTTERYAHLADDPLRWASEKLGAKLDAALSRSKQSAGEVAALKGRKS